MTDDEVDTAIREFVGLLFKEQGAPPSDRKLPPDYWENAQ